MANKTKEKEPKKIVFSEEVDSAITGYALGFTFMGIGCFLFFNPSYFFSPIASYIIGAIISAFGVMGTGVELSKSSKIKGMDGLSIGLVCLAIWFVSYIKIKSFWTNIFFFTFLVIGCFGILQGFFQAVYSILQNIKAEKRQADKDKKEKISFGKLASQLVLFLTQLCSLVLALLNVIKAVSM